MKKLILFILLILLTPHILFAAPPVVFFSDLTDGNRTGWEGSETKGAAVSIWGLNFGSATGTSKVTCAGQELVSTSGTDIAEWNATTTPYVARGMGRITFWLNSSMSTGAQTITVTTSDGTSGTIPFYIRTTGDIYFADPDTGSDSDSGATVALAWESAYKARNTLTAGDVCYFKSGTYTDTDTSTTFIKFSNNHNNGTENNSISYAAYPGEAPMWGGSSSFFIGINIQGTDEEMDYHTFSKISIKVGASNNGNAIAWGSNYPTQQVTYFRLIGCDLTTLQDSKTIMGISGNNASNHYYILGNWFHDAGKDTRESAAGASKAYGLYIGGYGTSSYYYVGYNEMSWNVNNQGKGIQVYGHNGNGYSPADEVDNVYIYSNYIHDNNGEGMTLGGGDDGGGAGTSYGFIEDIYIYNNIVVNNGSTGIQIGGPSIETMGDGGNYYIYNNTLYNNSESLNISPRTDLGVFSNNILYQNSYYFDRAGTSAYMSGTKNIFYGDATDEPDWDTSPVNDDPKFEDAGSYDFLCQSDGGGVDQGSTITIATPDYVGISRPQNSVYDIGAYEYASGGSASGSCNIGTSGTGPTISESGTGWTVGE